MKRKLMILPALIILILYSSSIMSQDIPNWAWKTPMSRVTPVAGEYYNLPAAQDQVNYKNPNTQTRVLRNGNETIVLPPNFRPFPHTATQSEIDAATMRSNPNILWCAWNSYGPSFYGTGYAATTNGGTNWTGSNINFYTKQR